MKHENFAVTHTDEEWRKILSPEQFAVMREHVAATCEAAATYSIRQ